LDISVGKAVKLQLLANLFLSFPAVVERSGTQGKGIQE